MLMSNSARLRQAKFQQPLQAESQSHPTHMHGNTTSHARTESLGRGESVAIHVAPQHPDSYNHAEMQHRDVT
jgi:hypothetical protein